MSDLKQILNQFNVPYKTFGDHHHTTRGWISMDCVYCSPNSHKYRLGIEITTGRTNCWSCGIKNGAETLSILCNISKSEAIDIWKRTLRLQTKDIPYRGRLKMLAGIEDLMPQHRAYLKNRRGLDPDEISKLWGVKCTGITVRLPWSLFIPIHDEKGQIVSWTTRSIGLTNTRRYITARKEEEAISLKSVLYGSHLARSTIVIVEGPIDAWTIGPGAVATCGVGFNQVQRSLMSQYSYRAVCFDSDYDAQKRAERLCKQLSASVGVTENIVLESGSDPSDADSNEILEIREKYLI